MVLRVIDLETTGIDPDTDAIVEIASIDLTQAGGMERSVSALVNPGKPIPPEASAVHHLIDKDVEDAKPIEDVISHFIGADIYVAHRAEFEQGFLDRYFPDTRWLCTYKCALRVWPDAPGHGNQALRYWLGIVEPFGRERQKIEPHRALSDCLVTGAIAHRLLKAASFSDLLAWSNEPALLHTFPFGKHRNVPLADVPADYLRWVIDKSDLDESAKFSAAHWLEKRSESETV